MQRAGIALFILVGLMASPSRGHAAVATAPLPARAQAAVDKGVASAVAHDYLAAIRSFEEARKIAPQAPVVFLNLGLAEAQIPGRELRAVAWFGAYLAAYPEAPNVAGVTAEARRLLEKHKEALFKLFSRAVVMAGETEGGIDGSKAEIYGLWAKAGDIEGSLRGADKLDPFNKGEALRGIVIAQAAAGDVAGARKTAALITRADTRSRALTAVGKIQAQSGDAAGSRVSFTAASAAAGQVVDDDYTKGIAQGELALAEADTGDMPAALTVANSIQNTYLRVKTLARLGAAQAASGDVAGAKLTLAAAQKKADEGVADPVTQNFNRIGTAELQVAIGDVSGARKTLAAGTRATDVLVQRWANGKRKDGEKAGTAGWIVESGIVRQTAAYLATAGMAQARGGDIAGARKTVGAMPDDYAWQRENVLTEIAGAQAQAGDVTGALKTASAIGNVVLQGQVQERIAAARPVRPQLKRPGENPRVAEWLEKLDETMPGAECPLGTLPFLDLAAHFRLLPAPVASGANMKYQVFRQFEQTLIVIVRARSAVERALKF